MLYAVLHVFFYFLHFILIKPFSGRCLENIKSCIEISAVPIEGEHAACDGHVHRHLSGHPANHKHLLSCVGVEGGVVDVLGPPELILRQTRLYDPSSEEVKTVGRCNIFQILKKQQSLSNTLIFILEHTFNKIVNFPNPRYTFLLFAFIYTKYVELISV